MAKPITFDVQRLIAAVATEHRLLFKPDDAAFAIVTPDLCTAADVLAKGTETQPFGDPVIIG